MNIIKSDFKFNGELKKRTSTDYFIFHNAKAKQCTVLDVHRWHLMRGWIGFGYNFFISKTGETYEGRPIWASDADAFGYNDNSLSCCFEGDFDNEHMTEAQIESGILLLRHCRKLYPKIQGMRHMDVNDTRCPGENFRNEIIIKGMQDVEETIDNNYKNCVDLVAGQLGLNSPDYWYKHPDKYVQELIVKMANRLYQLTDI